MKQYLIEQAKDKIGNDLQYYADLTNKLNDEFKEWTNLQFKIPVSYQEMVYRIDKVITDLTSLLRQMGEIK